mmetsp:Transcript_35980/g.76794  ORF Transcript_35980/g.76794 Transcript_35980/m.76794 type:complete len:201 (-) Transcript_35980:756-1358(-)
MGLAEAVGWVEEVDKFALNGDFVGYAKEGARPDSSSLSPSEPAAVKFSASPAAGLGVDDAGEGAMSPISPPFTPPLSSLPFLAEPAVNATTTHSISTHAKTAMLIFRRRVFLSPNIESQHPAHRPPQQRAQQPRRPPDSLSRSLSSITCRMAAYFSRASSLLLSSSLSLSLPPPTLLRPASQFSDDRAVPTDRGPLRRNL